MPIFGRIVKSRRLASGLGLSDFCERFKVDPVAWSLMERGRIAPPSGELLRKYAEHLGLQEGTPEWYEFFDAAREDANIRFRPLSDDELAGKLPVFFRTNREVRDDGGEDRKDLLEDLKAVLKKVA